MKNIEIWVIHRVIWLSIFIGLFKPTAISQTSNKESLYMLNTTLSISQYYIKNKKYACALHAIKQLNPELFESINIYNLADIYLANRDSISAENSFLKYFSKDNKIEFISQISNLKSPYNFVFKNHKSYFDSLYLIFLKSNIENQNNKKIEEMVSKMITEDQFVRKNLFLFCKTEDSIIYAIHFIDSVNMIRLKNLIRNDTMCRLTINRYPSLFTLYIHFTRYDTTIFNEIIMHNEKCMTDDMKFYYNTMLTDNRLLHLYNKEKFYTFLFKSIDLSGIDYELVDNERRKIGIESLYFSFLENNMVPPKYYSNMHKKYFTCNEK